MLTLPASACNTPVPLVVCMLQAVLCLARSHVAEDVEVYAGTLNVLFSFSHRKLVRWLYGCDNWSAWHGNSS